MAVRKKLTTRQCILFTKAKREKERQGEY